MYNCVLAWSLSTFAFFATISTAWAQNPADWSTGTLVLEQADLSAFTDSGPEQPTVVVQTLPNNSKRLVMAVSALTNDSDTNCPDGVYEVFLFTSTDGINWSELLSGPVVEQTTINGALPNDFFTCGAKTPLLMSANAGNKLFLVVEGMQRTDQCDVYAGNNEFWLYGCDSTWSDFVQGTLVFNTSGNLVASGGHYFRDIGFSWDAFEEAEGLSAVRGPDGPVIFYEDGGEILHFQQLSGGFWTSPSAVLSPDDFGTSWDDDELFNPSATCSPEGNIKLHVGGRTTSGGVGDPITSAGWLSALSGDLGYTFDLGATQFTWSDDEQWRSWDSLVVGPLSQYVTYYETINATTGDHEIFLTTTDSSWSVDDVQDDVCSSDGSCWIDVAILTVYERAVSLRADGSVEDTEGSTTPPTSGLSQVDGGANDFCGIDSSGTVQCFSDYTDPHGITTSEPTSGSWEMVEVSSTFACALKDDGSVACWGADTYNQVSDTPTGTGFKDVATGALAACAIDSSDELVCWGRDNENQVSGAPTGTYSDVSCGYHYCLAIAMSDGHIEGWGTSSVLASIPSATGFETVSAGKVNALALDASGNLTAWGNDAHDLVTDVSTGGIYDGVTWRVAEMSELLACGIVDDPNGVTGLSSGDVQCWSDNVVPTVAREDAADGCL